MLGRWRVCDPGCRSHQRNTLLTCAEKFHNLVYAGFEERGCGSARVLAVGDVATSAQVLHLARVTKSITPVVTVYTDGSEELAKRLQFLLESAGIIGLSSDLKARQKIQKSIYDAGIR